MSTTRMVATRKQKAFITHICSECGFPQITVVQIEAEAQKAYDSPHCNAGQIASKTAKNAIQEEINRIEACYQTKQPLTLKQKGSSMIARGHFCSSWISGFDSYCPKCLRIEPWKSIDSEKKMDELAKENFPIVFIEADDAKNWAHDKVKEMFAEISAKRENPAEIEKAINSVKKSKAEILMLIHKVNALPEKIEYDKLNEELKILRSKKSKCLLNFKAKKIINNKIKAVESQIESVKAILDSKVLPITMQFISMRNNLLTTQAIAFGYVDDILCEKRGTAYSFFFSPNDIPPDIMEEIEHDAKILFEEESAKSINN